MSHPAVPSSRPAAGRRRGLGGDNAAGPPRSGSHLTRRAPVSALLRSKPCSPVRRCSVPSSSGQRPTPAAPVDTRAARPPLTRPPLTRRASTSDRDPRTESSRMRRDDAIVLGEGILDWPKAERISNRYGAVFLLPADPGGPGGSAIRPDVPVDTDGTLSAEVLATRRSHHVGDLFRGIYPTTPSVGETITLGTGRLFVERGCDVDVTVGLCPAERRDSDWLDPTPCTASTGRPSGCAFARPARSRPRSRPRSPALPVTRQHRHPSRRRTLMNIGEPRREIVIEPLQAPAPTPPPDPVPSPPPAVPAVPAVPAELQPCRP